MRYVRGLKATYLSPVQVDNLTILEWPRWAVGQIVYGHDAAHLTVRDLGVLNMKSASLR